MLQLYWMRNEDGTAKNVVFEEWRIFMDDMQNRRILLDHVEDAEHNQIDISTVFLGINHNFIEDAPPILWETMIFGGTHDGYCDRYSSEEKARAGHTRALEMEVKSVEAEKFNAQVQGLDTSDESPGSADDV